MSSGMAKLKVNNKLMLDVILMEANKGLYTIYAIYTNKKST